MTGTGRLLRCPLDKLPVGESIESLRIVGSLRGTFYIDDMRLVAERPVIEPTAVGEAGEQATPTDVVLEANYPNPFNAQTILRYRLNANGPVRLDVYSLSGQKVRTLVDQTQEAGVYNIAWNGQDADGRSVASGVYHGVPEEFRGDAGAKNAPTKMSASITFDLNT